MVLKLLVIGNSTLWMWQHEKPIDIFFMVPSSWIQQVLHFYIIHIIHCHCIWPCECNKKWISHGIALLYRMCMRFYSDSSTFRCCSCFVFSSGICTHETTIMKWCVVVRQLYRICFLENQAIIPTLSHCQCEVLLNSLDRETEREKEREHRL